MNARLEAPRNNTKKVTVWPTKHVENVGGVRVTLLLAVMRDRQELYVYICCYGLLFLAIGEVNVARVQSWEIGEC